ncbi:hypothetical protein E1218_07570 [Kribbella turkmenica]|uniref:Probable 2-phosphosulfolactate phosphatase n=1 Tax=Kribbella turkmenica TaxID=2530375 RepID=A0A4R4XCM4_9ACTN|nr:2-phosphosulfolactate phosphatase [Kribbella turkmenica]TDD28370.1 hypothetical protein E1218_07570 [Kribbella turkmenica]
MSLAVPVSDSTSSIVWQSALSKYKILGSQTPAGFTEKRSHVPDDDAAVTSAIFADILRATTTLIAAAAAGCGGIYVDVKPTLGVFPFERPPNIHDPGTWVFGGELNGRPVEGMDHEGHTVEGIIGNSPLSVVPKSFEGQLLRFFSTNGSRAFRELLVARLQDVYALSMANIDATVDAVLQKSPRRIWLACGGFYGSSSLEDSVACGLATSRLIELGFTDENGLDDEALHMLLLSRSFECAGKLDEVKLVSAMLKRQVPQLLDDIGRLEDVPACVSGNGMDAELWREMSRTTLALASQTEPYLRSTK